jgi:hypothetical protein
VSGALLKGAQFRIYGSQADALARTNPVGIKESTTTGYRYLDGSTDAQAAADPDTYGHAMIPGFVTCNYEEHPDASLGVYISGELAYGKYWVVETAAPAGYILDSTPHAFWVTDGTVLDPSDPSGLANGGVATSWGINGPRSPACTAPGATASTPIPVTPIVTGYNPTTGAGAWTTTNDWAIARVINAVTPVAGDSGPSAGTGGTLVPTRTNTPLLAGLAAALFTFAAGLAYLENRRRRYANTGRTAAHQRQGTRRH